MSLHNWLIAPLSCVDTSHIYIACKSFTTRRRPPILRYRCTVYCALYCTVQTRRSARGRQEAGVSWDMFRTDRDNQTIAFILRSGTCVLAWRWWWSNGDCNNLRKSWPPPHVTRVRIMVIFHLRQVRQIHTLHNSYFVHWFNDRNHNCRIRNIQTSLQLNI